MLLREVTMSNIIRGIMEPVLNHLTVTITTGTRHLSSGVLTRLAILLNIKLLKLKTYLPITDAICPIRLWMIHNPVILLLSMIKIQEELYLVLSIVPVVVLSLCTKVTVTMQLRESHMIRPELKVISVLLIGMQLLHILKKVISDLCSTT